jgi:Fe-S-cluster containining protein
MLTVKPISNPSNICLSCGLCCDGTLIGFVEVDRAELPAVRKVMDLEEENSLGFFLQPCLKYCAGCTIYENRPKNCDNFNCGLLKSVQQEKIDFDEALKSIADVKQKKKSIEKLLKNVPFTFQSNSFYFKMFEVKKLLDKKKLAGILNKNEQALIDALYHLNKVLTDKFDLDYPNV